MPLTVSPSLGKPPPGRVGDVRPLCSADHLPGLRTLDDLQRFRHQSDSNNTAVNRLWDATSASWRNTLPPPVCPPADRTSAVATIISRLGWERGVRTQLPIYETTARSATRMQLGTFRRDRHCHVLRYATSALQGTPADPARTAAAAANTLLIDMADCGGCRGNRGTRNPSGALSIMESPAPAATTTPHLAPAYVAGSIL